MFVVLALIGYIVGQVATVFTLLATAVVTANARHPITFAPLVIAGLWIAGTVDFVDMTDGPMRIDADAFLVGAGGGIPPALSNGADGPAWWIAVAALACFATLSLWPKLPYLRAVAAMGLVALAITYAGLGAIEVMY